MATKWQPAEPSRVAGRYGGAALLVTRVIVIEQTAFTVLDVGRIARLVAALKSALKSPVRGARRAGRRSRRVELQRWVQANPLVIKTSPGYRIYLHRLRGTAGHPVRGARAVDENAVLQSHAEAKEAQLQVNRLGLPEHATLEKNWDTLAALDGILQEVPRDGWILDAGAELYSTVLPSLFLYGYRNLHGINLEFSEPIRHGTIVYAHGDLEDAFSHARRPGGRETCRAARTTGQRRDVGSRSGKAVGSSRIRAPWLVLLCTLAALFVSVLLGPRARVRWRSSKWGASTGRPT